MWLPLSSCSIGFLYSSDLRSLGMQNTVICLTSLPVSKMTSPFRTLLLHTPMVYLLFPCSVVVSDIVSAGTHPYFVYQESVLSLSAKDGELFYEAMLDIVRCFEHTYPHAVMSTVSIPSRTSHIPKDCLPRMPSVLPPELLEHIFSISDATEWLVSCLVCHAWCFAASWYSHTAIVFCMNTDWQHWDRSPEGKKDAELYAFAMEFIMVCITFRWCFPVWIHRVTYVNWPLMPVPFFF